MKARFIAQRVPDTYVSPSSSNSEWTDFLRPSERRDLRVAAAGFLGGLVTREEMRATITAAKFVAACRRRAEVGL